MEWRNRAVTLEDARAEAAEWRRRQQPSAIHHQAPQRRPLGRRR